MAAANKAHGLQGEALAWKRCGPYFEVHLLDEEVLSWPLRDPVNVRVQLPGEAEGNLKVTRDHEVVARR